MANEAAINAADDTFARACAAMDFRSAKRYTKISFECLAAREFTDYAFWRSLSMRLLTAALTWRDGGEPAVISRVAMVDRPQNPRTLQIRVPRKNTRWADGVTTVIREDGSEEPSEDDASDDAGPPPMPKTGGAMLGVFGIKVAPVVATASESAPILAPTVETGTVLASAPAAPTPEKKFSLSLAFARKK